MIKRMIKIVLVLILLVFSCKNKALAQKSSFFTILQYYNYIKINAVSTLGNDSYIMIGTVTDRNEDILIAIFNKDGSLKWHRFVDFYDEVTGLNTLDEGLNVLDFPEDSSFIVLGSTLAGENTVILRYNYNLELKWSKWIKTGFNYCTNLYKLGSNTCFIGSYSIINDRSMQKPFIIQLDKEGNEVWKTNFDITGWNSTVGQANTLALDADGSFMVAGIAKESAQSSNYYSFVAKIDASGSVVWTKTYDSFTNEETIISILNTGTNYYLLSPTISTIKINTLDAIGASKEIRNVELAGLKYPRNFINNADTLYASSSPIADSSGCYFLKIGTTDANVLNQSFNVSGNFDFDDLYIAKAVDSSFLITGNIYTDGSDISYRASFIKLDQDGKSVLEPSYDFLNQALKINEQNKKSLISIIWNLKVYEIENLDLENVNFELIDASGKTIAQGLIHGLSMKTLDMKAFKSGVYFIHFFNTKINETHKIMH